jgi:DNA-directed RNA polymerase specialized sigma24 family protein
MIQTVWRLVRNPDDTGDVVQAAIERTLKVLPKIRRHNNPTAYILRICMNAAYDHLRGKRRWIFSEELKPMPFEQISPDLNPADLFDRKERSGFR